MNNQGKIKRIEKAFEEFKKRLKEIEKEALLLHKKQDEEKIKKLKEKIKSLNF